MAFENENVTPNSEQDNPSGDPLPEVGNHRALKTLVLVLGVAIIGMIGLIVYKIVEQFSSDGSPEEVSVSQPAQSPSRAVLDGDVSIERPTGSTLASVDVRGDDILFHFTFEDGSHRIVLYDRSSGKTLTLNVPADRQD